MGHLEGNFTPVLYMGRKVPKGEISFAIFVAELVVCIWKSAPLFWLFIFPSFQITLKLLL